MKSNAHHRKKNKTTTIWFWSISHCPRIYIFSFILFIYYYFHFILFYYFSSAKMWWNNSNQIQNTFFLKIACKEGLIFLFSWIKGLFVFFSRDIFESYRAKDIVFLAKMKEEVITWCFFSYFVFIRFDLGFNWMVLLLYSIFFLICRNHKYLKRKIVQEKLHHIIKPR